MKGTRKTIKFPLQFSCRDNLGKDKYMNEFTLHRFLKRQKVVLHGYDERNFKYLPKVIIQKS